MFSISRDTNSKVQQETLTSENLQLWQTTTSRGKKWVIISKSEHSREGVLLAEGKALQKLFEEAAADQPISDSRLQIIYCGELSWKLRNLLIVI